MLILPIVLAALISAEQKLAVQMLSDVAIRGDLAGIEIAKQRIAGAPGDAARKQYLLALADFETTQFAFTDVARSKEAARRADEEVEKALALDPDLVDALVLRNRLAYILTLQGTIDRKTALARMSETLEKAKKLAPDDPGVKLIDASSVFATDRARGRVLLRAAIDKFAERAPDDPIAAIWLPSLWTWYGGALMADGDIEAAREAFESALKVRPDYTYARTALLPMTNVVESETEPSGDWTAWISDAEGDGRVAANHDLRAVSWRRAGDRVWFRFDLAKPADATRLGINLALDTDGDPANGNAWWAGNTAFQYDRLVTVWVGRGRDGKYRGTVGAASAEDVKSGRYATMPNAVGFAVDNAIFVSVDRSILGDHSRVVATVGSNTDWNDVAPAEGAAVLEVARR